jgi:hypothetical protein
LHEWGIVTIAGYLSRENPHWTQDSRSQRQGKLNIWIGIIGRHLTGPYFFEGNLTAASYLDFLRFDLVPALTAMFPDNHEADVPH